MRTSFSTNQIILQGNVTRDPNAQFTKGGTFVMKFGLATNYSKKVGEEFEDVVTFHNIVCFGKGAEWLENRIKKGHKVLVIGRQENRTFEKEDGTKAYISEVVAETITPFLTTNGSKKAGDTEDVDSEEVSDDVPF